MPKAAIVDIDGTLVDSNELHVQAWREVFLRYGKDVPARSIRPQMGKGGDQLMPVFWSPAELEKFGDEMQDLRVRIFVEKYLPLARPFPGVRRLFERLRREGVRIALATSAREAELEHHLRTLRVDDLVEGVTSADDAQCSKPCPDILEAALDRLPGVAASEAFLVGDSPYDGQAAARAGMHFVGVLTGGFSADELQRSGALEVYRDVAELAEKYEAWT